ncbi:hypothetical protein TVAG_068160 [Trichomonas vaginalis G3]|uniref:Uncharacterized protein n=1 Tax=Trichomonas vaginalis (strain ATCC PRA-98 / G3) TaxID=412133 RepID=A2EMK0_TRIV3|nr:hypothetical protein TVAGG3_0499770 [Trichomonas vaginalis G3]EAY06156.1 hypothetical protein TVAG_068160 [Trichomonas vaginalis G3]KAI5516988.1 hypothetical protein TVAGG3_0499770 [Trichomonas vaginalis G3]|eukprot:XP_001318379.1 hypothetical protein [Trichomonas vaginalis G3]
MAFEFNSIFQYPQYLYWTCCIAPLMSLILIILWDWHIKGEFDTTIVVPIAFISTASARTINGWATFFTTLSLYFLTGDVFKFLRRAAPRKTKPFMYKLARLMYPIASYPCLFAHIMAAFYIARFPKNQLVYHAMAYSLQPVLFVLVDICCASIGRSIGFWLYLFDLFLCANVAAYIYYGYERYYCMTDEFPIELLALLGYAQWIGNAIRWPIVGYQLRGNIFFHLVVIDQ